MNFISDAFDRFRQRFRNGTARDVLEDDDFVRRSCSETSFAQIASETELTRILDNLATQGAMFGVTFAQLYGAVVQELEQFFRGTVAATLGQKLTKLEELTNQRTIDRYKLTLDPGAVRLLAIQILALYYVRNLVEAGALDRT